MCVVSNIGDTYRESFPQRWNIPLDAFTTTNVNNVSRGEFDALKREVEELKKLLKAAKAFDDATGQRECQMDEKVEFIKKLADLVGVDLEDVFGAA